MERTNICRKRRRRSVSRQTDRQREHLFQSIINRLWAILWPHTNNYRHVETWFPLTNFSHASAVICVKRCFGIINKTLTTGKVDIPTVDKMRLQIKEIAHQLWFDFFFLSFLLRESKLVNERKKFVGFRFPAPSFFL